MKYLIVALLLSATHGFFTETSFRNVPRFAMNRALKSTTASSSIEGLQQLPINLFGKGELGKGADSKWLLGGKG